MGDIISSSGDIMMHVGDIMSTSGDVQYIGGYHEYIGGYHEYIGGYHEYIGRCSVYQGDIMIHLGKQVGKLNLPISIENPDVLNIHRWYHGIPHMHHDSLQCTEYPQMYSRYSPMYSWHPPDALNTSRCTEHTLYRVT